MATTYTLNSDVYFSTPRCKDYAAQDIDGVTHHCIQGALQLACTGDWQLVRVTEDSFEKIPGPITTLAEIDGSRLNWITHLNNMGQFDRASREMLNFALECKVVRFAEQSLTETREFSGYLLSLGGQG
jgi:hypothetical protein